MSEILLENVLSQAYRSSQGRGRGGEGRGSEVVLNKSLCGKTPPRGPTPYLFIYQFCQKKVPLFVYFLLTNSTPHMPSLKFNIAENALSFVMKNCIPNFARVHSLFILGSFVSVFKAAYVVIFL